MLDKDEVKDTIVGVARNIFSRFGFKKTTMDEIAIAARKGKSSIYYYFTSKEEIIRLLLKRKQAFSPRNSTMQYQRLKIQWRS